MSALRHLELVWIPWQNTQTRGLAFSPLLKKMGMLSVEHLTLGFEIPSLDDWRLGDFAGIDEAFVPPGFSCLRFVRIMCKGPVTSPQLEKEFGTAFDSLKKRQVEIEIVVKGQ